MVKVKDVEFLQPLGNIPDITDGKVEVGVGFDEKFYYKYIVTSI